MNRGEKVPRLHVTFLLLLALLVAPLGGAQAAPIFFGFSLQFSSGPLLGQSFAGTLSVDGNDCAGPCDGTFAPNLPDNTLLSFDVTVDGTPFAITDDKGYDLSPQVTFDDDVVTSVDFISDAPPDSKLLSIDGTQVFFSPSGSSESNSEGSFVAGRRVTVPEPGTIALLGLGLAGLAAARRRKQ